MLLIINADDFGLNGKTNSGILEGFKKGLCSSTTLIANASGFQEACQLAHEQRLLDHIGVHLTLRDANPLTEKIRRFSVFCNTRGQLRFSPKSFLINLGNAQKCALADEIRAQIKRCRESGIPLTHMDAHHSLHTIWAVASVLITIARQERIPYIRIKANTDLYAIPLRFKMYTRIFNYRLRVLNLARTRYFGSVKQYLALKQMFPSKDIDSLEICVHPEINDAGRLRDLFFNEELDLEAQVKKIDAYKDIVSFSGARYLQ